MILEGFEIENWSCIKSVAISGLPRTGVIVLYGPNRRGKSSIVHALRACLMDFASTSNSQELRKWFPRTTGERPVVSVTFTSNGTSYRIRKHFGSNKSELASKTSQNAWKPESASAADAHERTRALTGGVDSDKGLHQLLWLTQAEFRLPETKKFDDGVQARLRGIFGALQTPLDDRFIESVKERWKTWFTGQRKGDKQSEIKKGCRLADALSKLTAEQKELENREIEFREAEGQIRKMSDLEFSKCDLEGQLKTQRGSLAELRKESNVSQVRIETRKGAEGSLAAAKSELSAAESELSTRNETVTRLAEQEKLVAPAKAKDERLQGRVEKLDRERNERKKAIHDLRDDIRRLKEQLDRAEAAAKAQVDRETLGKAEEQLAAVDKLQAELDGLDKYLKNNPAPDKATLQSIRTNRDRLKELQAEQKAAMLLVNVVTEPGASIAQLKLDGNAVDASVAGSHQVRQSAEVRIVGWGRIEIQRGVHSLGLDEIEESIKTCRDEITSAASSFGFSGLESNGFDALVQLAATNEQKSGELDTKKKQFSAAYPNGREPLLKRVNALKTSLKPNLTEDLKHDEPNPIDPAELANRVLELKAKIASNEAEIDKIDEADERAENVRSSATDDETQAKVDFAKAEQAVNSTREELNRLRNESDIQVRITSARSAVEAAKARLLATELTNEERTVGDRLKAAEKAVGAIEKQREEVANEFSRIKGRLEGSEGLHAERAAAEARVEAIERFIESETLQKDAIDRLYALFEECRDKRLGSLMTPIHDRVVNWLQVLDIGDYKEMRFNNALLPEKLITRDGIAEIEIGEESTGAQEQIGMLVRLGLGSVLTSVNDPTVAILDDPLTHCDISRLNRMRVILSRIAAGDATLDPPAAPMQIVILTCHPEWFRDDSATVINLEDSSVMTRYSV